MNIQSRVVIVFVIRLVFLFFAVWIAVKPEAIEGASLIARIGFVALFLVMAVMVGEVARLHTQFEMFIRALRSAGVKVQDDGGKTDKEAIGILIRALGSRDEETREKAHRHLKRLSGQELPPDPKAWERWWKEAKKTM